MLQPIIFLLLFRLSQALNCPWSLTISDEVFNTVEKNNLLVGKAYYIDIQLIGNQCNSRALIDECFFINSRLYSFQLAPSLSSDSKNNERSFEVELTFNYSSNSWTTFPYSFQFNQPECFNFHVTLEDEKIAVASYLLTNAFAFENFASFYACATRENWIDATSSKTWDFKQLIGFPTAALSSHPNANQFYHIKYTNSSLMEATKLFLLSFRSTQGSLLTPLLALEDFVANQGADLSVIIDIQEGLLLFLSSQLFFSPGWHPSDDSYLLSSGVNRAKVQAHWTVTHSTPVLLLLKTSLQSQTEPARDHIYYAEMDLAEHYNFSLPVEDAANKAYLDALAAHLTQPALTNTSHVLLAVFATVSDQLLSLSIIDFASSALGASDIVLFVQALYGLEAPPTFHIVTCTLKTSAQHCALRFTFPSTLPIPRLNSGQTDSSIVVNSTEDSWEVLNVTAIFLISLQQEYENFAAHVIELTYTCTPGEPLFLITGPLIWSSADTHQWNLVFAQSTSSLESEPRWFVVSGCSREHGLVLVTAYPAGTAHLLSTLDPSVSIQVSEGRSASVPPSGSFVVPTLHTLTPEGELVKIVADSATEQVSISPVEMDDFPPFLRTFCMVAQNSTPLDNCGALDPLPACSLGWVLQSYFDAQGLTCPFDPSTVSYTYLQPKASSHTHAALSPLFPPHIIYLDAGEQFSLTVNFNYFQRHDDLLMLNAEAQLNPTFHVSSPFQQLRFFEVKMSTQLTETSAITTLQFINTQKAVEPLWQNPAGVGLNYTSATLYPFELSKNSVNLLWSSSAATRLGYPSPLAPPLSSRPAPSTAALYSPHPKTAAMPCLLPLSGLSEPSAFLPPTHRRIFQPITVAVGCPPGRALTLDAEASKANQNHRCSDTVEELCLYYDYAFTPQLIITDNAANVSIPYTGQYRFYIDGGGQSRDQIRTFSPEEIESYNAGNKAIWTGDSDGLFQNRQATVNWVCSPSSPCYDVLPSSFGAAPEYFFRAKFITKGIDSSSYCAYEYDIIIRLYGIPMSFLMVFLLMFCTVCAIGLGSILTYLYILRRHPLLATLKVE